MNPRKRPTKTAEIKALQERVRELTSENHVLSMSNVLMEDELKRLRGLVAQWKSLYETASLLYREIKSRGFISRILNR